MPVDAGDLEKCFADAERSVPRDLKWGQGRRVPMGPDRGGSDFPGADFSTGCTKCHVRAIAPPSTRGSSVSGLIKPRVWIIAERVHVAEMSPFALGAHAHGAVSPAQLGPEASLFGRIGMFPGGAERWPRTLISAARTHPTPSTPRARPMATASSSTPADSRFPSARTATRTPTRQARHPGRRVEPIPFVGADAGAGAPLVRPGRIVRAAVRPGPGRRHVVHLHRRRRRQPPRRQRGGQAARRERAEEDLRQIDSSPWTAAPTSTRSRKRSTGWSAPSTRRRRRGRCSHRWASTRGCGCRNPSASPSRRWSGGSRRWLRGSQTWGS